MLVARGSCHWQLMSCSPDKVEVCAVAEAATVVIKVWQRWHAVLVSSCRDSKVAHSRWLSWKVVMGGYVSWSLQTTLILWHLILGAACVPICWPSGLALTDAAITAG
jgi:hypothetical protein